MLACKGNPLSGLSFHLGKGDGYFEFFRLALLVVLGFVHGFLELLHFRFSCRLRLLRSLDSCLHLCDRRLNLCYLGADLKRGPSVKGRLRRGWNNDVPSWHCYCQPVPATVVAQAP